MKTADRPTPFGYTVFCDDIRLEASGKITLVGIYAGELTVLGSLPNNVAKFGMRISYSERPGESDEPVELWIFMPGDEENAPSVKAAMPVEALRKQPPDPDLAGKDPLQTIFMHLEFAPLPLKEEGFIRVRVHRGDLEIKLGALRIRAQPSQPITISEPGLQPH